MAKVAILFITLFAAHTAGAPPEDLRRLDRNLRNINFPHDAIKNNGGLNMGECLRGGTYSNSTVRSVVNYCGIQGMNAVNAGRGSKAGILAISNCALTYNYNPYAVPLYNFLDCTANNYRT